MLRWRFHCLSKGFFNHYIKFNWSLLWSGTALVKFRFILCCSDYMVWFRGRLAMGKSEPNRALLGDRMQTMVSCVQAALKSRARHLVRYYWHKYPWHLAFGMVLNFGDLRSSLMAPTSQKIPKALSKCIWQTAVKHNAPQRMNLFSFWRSMWFLPVLNSGRTLYF